LVAVACGGRPATPTAPVVASGPASQQSAAPEAPALLPASAQGVALKVENPLAETRGPETVAVKLSDLLRIMPSLDPARVVVVDQAGRAVLSQLVDQNGDEAPDELVFQTSFAAGETKGFRVQVGERKPLRYEDFKVYGRFVRERKDDFAFESDRIAHRMYGPELETWKKEPLTSSGVDVWAKRSKRLVINEWYLTDDYHRDNGDGADLYSVKTARGCGGLGVWHAGKLQVSKNFVKSRVFSNGPLRLVFELEYAPYETGTGKAAEVKKITIDAGRNNLKYSIKTKT
jgi:hypothetical protein